MLKATLFPKSSMHDDLVKSWTAGHQHTEVWTPEFKGWPQKWKKKHVSSTFFIRASVILIILELKIIVKALTIIIRNKQLRFVCAQVKP